MYENGIPTKVKSIVISTQHSPDVNQSQVKEIVRPFLEKSIPKELLSGLKEEEFYVNPTGQFIIGGPAGDSGLTGRKIIVDTYGGAAPHGGGAFSGKDPTKVDRSGAYAARHVAKNLVAAGAADKLTVQIAYAIGVVEPVSIFVDTHGTAKVDERKIEDAVRKIFNLTPKGIIDSLDLLKPIYKNTSVYGHFGREEFSWEKLNKVEEIKGFLGL